MRKLITLPIFAIFLLVITLLLANCQPSTQEVISERNAVLGERDAQSNFFEAQQINAIEDWKDDPSKIVNLYIINPVTGGLLVPPIQCIGVPASSTESLEPNVGRPYRNWSGYWQVPVDGIDIATEELAGRDGTFGDPVHARQCMTVDGHYVDIPAYGLPYLVTSQAYSFPDATVQRDFETEARLLIAEEILNRGGCINPETLIEIECE